MTERRGNDAQLVRAGGTGRAGNGRLRAGRFRRRCKRIDDAARYSMRRRCAGRVARLYNLPATIRFAGWMLCQA